MSTRKKRRSSAKVVLGKIFLVLTCLVLFVAFVALGILLYDKFSAGDGMDKLTSLSPVIAKIILLLLSHEMIIYVVITLLIVLLTLLEITALAKVRAYDRRKREERDVIYIREQAKREVNEKFPSYDYLLEEMDYLPDKEDDVENN